jgi:hypothetical protein
MPAWTFIVALLSAPVLMLVGIGAGAWLFYCGQQNRMPLPRIGMSIGKLLHRNGQASDEEKDEAPKRPMPRI